MLCPFKKKETIEFEYRMYNPGENKPKVITKTEDFEECDVSCQAYDGGVCQMMKGSKQ